MLFLTLAPDLEYQSQYVDRNAKGNYETQDNHEDLSTGFDRKLALFAEGFGLNYWEGHLCLLLGFQRQGGRLLKLCFGLLWQWFLDFLHDGLYVFQQIHVWYDLGAQWKIERLLGRRTAKDW